MSHQTLAGGSGDREARIRRGKPFIKICLDVKDAIEEAGISVDIVSSGESFTYDVAPEMPGVTEVQGGTYALMSHGHAMADDFQVAGKVLASVTSVPQRDVAIGDVGYRALTSPDQIPGLEGLPGVRVEAIDEDQIVLRSEGTMPLSPGDRFVLLPAVQDIMANRWDRFIAVRGGNVEAVWDIAARGCLQ